MANDTVNRGASVAQEPSVVAAVLGVTRGPGIVSNWSGNAVSFHILSQGGDMFATEGGDRITTEGS
jgi:hypothetical protein